VELANLAGESLEEVIAAAERGIHRIRHTHHLPFSFLRHCGLSYGEPAAEADHRRQVEHEDHDLRLEY
jgi:hypothetical protein